MAGTLSIAEIGRAGDAPLGDLVRPLVETVAGGASVGYLHPLDPAEARRYRQDVAAGAARGEVVLLVARLDGRVVGTVQLVPEPRENQPHRVEIRKLLVSAAGWSAWIRWPAAPATGSTPRSAGRGSARSRPMR